MIFALLLLVGIKCEPIQKDNECLARLNALRGIFAIEIVVGHVVRYERTLLYPLGKFMIISVAFFFFVSAYGMRRSLRQKERYLNGFLLRKCGYLLVIAGVAYGVELLADAVFHLNLQYYDKSKSLLINFWEETNWYIWELLFFYVVFYLTYRYMKKYQVIVLCIITAALATALFLCGWKEGWYASALAFPCGLLFEEHEQSIMAALQTKGGGAAVAALCLLGVCSLGFSQQSLIGMVYLRNIMCIGALGILLLLVWRVRPGNRALAFLTMRSAEIYLYQFLLLDLTAGLGLPWKPRLLAVAAGTLVLSCVIYPFDCACRGMITKERR